jgi:hypothetical protein
LAAGEPVTRKSAACEPMMVGVPTVIGAEPWLVMTKVRATRPERIPALPKSVLSAGVGVVSPFAIETPFPKTAISGAEPDVPAMAKL